MSKTTLTKSLVLSAIMKSPQVTKLATFMYLFSQKLFCLTSEFNIRLQMLPKTNAKKVMLSGLDE